MAKSNRRPLAVFSINKLARVATFISRCRSITLNITNNAVIFVTPVPTIASTNTALDNLETANTVARTRVTGSAAARDVKYNIALEKMRGLMLYVQNLADNAADVTTATSIILASGFDLKNRGVRVKPDLAIKQSVDSGTLFAIAKSAGARVSYEWQQSTDGTTWTNLPSTLQAKTKQGGLTPGSRVYFRVRSVFKGGISPWSTPVSAIVQ